MSEGNKILVDLIVRPLGSIIGTILGIKIWEIIFCEHYVSQILEILTKLN